MDVLIKCDSCLEALYSKYSGLTTTKIKCLAMKNKSLKYFFSVYEQGIKRLPDLKLLIKKLPVEFEGPKNYPLQRLKYELCNKFIIKKRNRRAENLICHNIIESDSHQSDVRIAHYCNHVVSIIRAICIGRNQTINQYL